MNHRWYGGTLTNWKTISKTISRLRSIEELLDGEESSGLTKKELLKLNREREKLDTSIGGIKDMGGLPDLIFVLDTVKEQIAIQEATKLNIPIAAVIDQIVIQKELLIQFPAMMTLRKILLYIVI